MKHISEIIPEVVKDLELPRRELIKQKTGDTGKLQSALNSNLILKSSREALVQALRFIMVKIGLRANNFPDKIETEILIQHIYENFGGHRIEEIKLAFDLAIMGKLSCDVNCFENFSCAYFTKIMNSYQNWSREEYRQLNNEDQIIKKIDRLTIDIEYCYFMQKEIDLLPCKMKKLIHTKTD